MAGQSPRKGPPSRAGFDASDGRRCRVENDDKGVMGEAEAKSALLAIDDRAVPQGLNPCPVGRGVVPSSAAGSGWTPLYGT
jgi:hypothetical protein